MKHDVSKCERKTKRAIYDEIERENHRLKIKRPSYNGNYVCKLCGQYCECVLTIHAEQHGYKTKKEFLESGNLVAV